MLRFFSNKRTQGVVSIFLLIILLPTMLFSSLLMEIGRYYNAQNLLEEAAENAATSILADYNKKLYKEFGLLAFDEQDTEELKKNFISYLKPNCNEDTPENYSQAASKLVNLTENIDVTAMYNLKEYQVFVRQIEEYSKYRVAIESFEEMINIDKLKSDLLKKIGETILGKDVYKSLMLGIETMTKFLEFVNELKDMLICIKNLHGSIYGYTAMEGLANTIEGWKKWFWNEKDEKKASENGDYLEVTREELKKAIKERDKTIKKLNQKHKEQQEIIDLAKRLNDYFNENGEETFEPDNKFKDYFEEFSDISAISITKDSSLNDFYKIAQKDKYGFGLTAKELSLDEISNLAGKSISEKENDKITKKNKAVEDAKEKYLSSLAEVSSAFKSYSKQVAETLASVHLLNADEFNFGSIDTLGKLMGKVNELAVKSVDFYQDNADSGKNLCDHAKETVSKINAESLTDEAIDTPESEELEKLYISYKDAFTLVTAVNLIKMVDIIGKNSALVKFFKHLKKLKDTLQFTPYSFNSERCVELSPETDALNANTLVGKISEGGSSAGGSSGGGFRDSGGGEKVRGNNDREEIQDYLDDAKDVVPSQYYGDLEKLSPERRAENSALWNEILKRMNDTAEAVFDMMNHDTESLLEIFDLSIIKSILRWLTIVNSLKIIIPNVIWLMKKFVSDTGTVVDVLISDIKMKFTSSHYIKMHCSNRLDVSRVKKYEDAQVFNSANFEYVLVGNNSEISNQKIVFNRIFMLRFLSNIYTVLTDENAQELISIPIAGIILVVIWIYYESNIDMNLLVRVGTSVPLVKSHPILSPETLNDDKFMKKWLNELNHQDTSKDSKTKNGEIVDEKTKKEKAELEKTKNLFLGENEDETLFDFDYKDYLTVFLFLTPQKQMIERMQNVVQMEMRYKERESGEGKAEFMLSKANTYIRSDIKAELNPLLPLPSLSGGEIDASILGLKEVNYNGY